jgi:lipopolysaccharide transport system permease protein
MSRWWELLWALIAKDFKVRYKNTALGFLWSLANPLMFAAVFYIVFKHVMAAQTPNYLVFLLAGLFPWQWTATTLGSAPGVFVGSASIVKKVYFPRVLLPLAALGNNLVHFLIVIVVAVPVLVVAGLPPSAAWLVGVPALLVVQGAITLGLALMVATLNVYFRDLEFLTGIFVQLLFFVTPIFFSEAALPGSVRSVLAWNPMYHVIVQWRGLVMEGCVDAATLGVAAGVGAVTLAAGYGIYRSLEARLAEYL